MQKQELKKHLKARELLAIGLGAVVGWSWVIYGGLWSTLGGSLGGVFAFVITGVLCSLVGLVYAELTSAYPKVGGDMVFALEGIGTGASIVMMWTLLVFWVGLTMIETMMIPVIMSQLGLPIPMWGPLYEIAGGTVYASYLLISLAFNIFFAFVNTRGVAVSGKVQTFAVYILLAAAIFFFGSGATLGNTENMQPLFTDVPGFTAVFLMLPGFMAGFNAIPQAAEEASAPPKIVGRMVIATVWAAVLFYVLIVLGTSLGAPETVRTGDGLVVVETVNLLYNNFRPVALFMTFASLLGMLTTWNACYIAGSRLFVGLARAKYLPSAMAEIHPKYGTPVKSILVLCLVSSIIAFGGHNQVLYVGIINVFSFGLVISWILVSIAFLRLNKNQPELERPYKLRHPKLIGWTALIFSIAFLMLYMPFSPSGLLPGEWIAVVAILVVAGTVYFCWNKRGGEIPYEDRRNLLGLNGRGNKRRH